MQLFFRYKKNDSQKLMMWFLFFSIAVTLGDGMYLCPGEHRVANFIADLIGAITVPVIPFAAFLLFRALSGEKPSSSLITSVLVVMAIYASMLFMSVVLCGFDNLVSLQEQLMIEHRTYHPLEALGGVDTLPLGYRNQVYQFYLILSRPVFYLLIIIGMCAMLYYMTKQAIIRKVPFGQFCRFLFRGGSISSFYLLVVLCTVYVFLAIIRIIIGLDFMIVTPVVGVIYSIVYAQVLFMLGTTASMLPAQSFTMKSLFQQYTFEETGNSIDEAEIPVPAKPNAAVQSDSTTSAPAPLPEEAQTILRNLKRLMEDEQLYLNPNLTVEDVAADLRTNRVYISRIVNQMMHETFRNYVNRLRINYAKKYMRENPDHTQEAVAQACGYQDAASFNRKFRQLIGITPREWAARDAQEAAARLQKN